MFNNVTPLNGSTNYYQSEVRQFSGFLNDECLHFMAIDNFLPPTHQCQVFLLSHHHSDHMHGLRDFQFKLNQGQNQLLYCSELTASILINNNNLELDANKIVALKLHKTIIVYEMDSSCVNVTCLPAGHCPGSVMFLIEYSDKRILYTGDFRMNLESFKKAQTFLLNQDGSVKRIQDLYLDSTFALPSDYNEFPSRENSLKLIVEKTENWFKSSNNNKVMISLPACIGTDFILENLWKKFKLPIVMHEGNFNYYSQIEEMNYITCLNYDTEKKWIFHACQDFNCLHRKDPNVLIIKPCVLSFIKKCTVINVKQKYGVPYTETNRLIKIFYSSHSSLNELQQITNFLKPEKIYFNTEYIQYGNLMKNLFRISDQTNDFKNLKPHFISQLFKNKERYYRKKDAEEQVSKKLKIFD